jgi:hypothetical protein
MMQIPYLIRGEFMRNSNINLLETRKKLISEITSLSYDEFNKKFEEEWSIAQVCHHLILTEKAFTNAIFLGLNKIDGHMTKPKNIHLVLDRSNKFVAPEMVQPDIGPFEGKHSIDLLDQARSSLTKVLSSVEDKTVLENKSFKHPFFDELPLNQWIDLLYLHEKRHIEQIIEIKTLLKTSLLS